MGLSFVDEHPERVRAKGHHDGFKWIITDARGCIRIPQGHPWHGMEPWALGRRVDVRGVISFAEAAVPRGQGGHDDAFWFGFDHPGDVALEVIEAECRSLCRQARQAVNADIVVARGSSGVGEDEEEAAR